MNDDFKTFEKTLSSQDSIQLELLKALLLARVFHTFTDIQKEIGMKYSALLEESLKSAKLGKLSEKELAALAKLRFRLETEFNLTESMKELLMNLPAGIVEPNQSFINFIWTATDDVNDPSVNFSSIISSDLIQLDPMHADKILEGSIKILSEFREKLKSQDSPQTSNFH